MDWSGRKVLITGGASFIGSHLLDVLVQLGARVRVVDDLSSGRLYSIQNHLGNGKVEFIEADLKNPGTAEKAVAGMSIVFHLAADHGGRGYVELHQAACATNLLLDANIFRASHLAGVD